MAMLLALRMSNRRSLRSMLGKAQNLAQLDRSLSFQSPLHLSNTPAVVRINHTNSFQQH